MTWVKIDDAAHTHPKVLAAGPDGVCLWLAGLCYANAHATDGAIPARALGALYPSDDWTRADRVRLAARLVEAGLWEVTADGWRIHGYEEHQGEAMRAARDERRAWERDRKARQRAAKTAKSGASDSADLGGLSHRDRGGTAPWDNGGTGVGQVPGTTVGHARGTIAPAGQGTPVDMSHPPDPPRPDQTRSLPEERETPPPLGGVRCGTKERHGYTADALAVTLTQRAKGKVLAAGADARVLARLQLAMDALTRGPLAATRASYEVLADWYAAGAQDWREGRLTLRELADGRLGEHLEAAMEWDRGGRRAITHAPPATARTRKLGPAPASGVDLSQYDNALGGK